MRKWFLGATTEDIIAAAMIEPIGSISWQKLQVHFPSLTELLKSPTSRIVKAGVTEHQANSIVDRPTNVESAMRLMKSKNIKLLTIDGKEYPQLLREINDPPLWLFVRGDVKTFEHTCLTVVGTRKPTTYALAAIEKLLPIQLIEKLCLVSGLAYGIDKQVHMLALKHKTPTIAVLAGGLDSIYPADHHRLAEQIIDSGGLLVSEYPPLSRPYAARFPIRNRIIAGLSKVTVVIEAAIKSGSLTTAKAALDYNRDIFAVPSDVNRKNTGGTNFLIKQGATLLDEPSQLFEAYGIKSTVPSSHIDSQAAGVLHLLAGDPLSADQLAQLTKKSIAEILGILTLLELGGQVFQPSAGMYLAKK